MDTCGHTYMQKNCIVHFLNTMYVPHTDFYHVKRVFRRIPYATARSAHM